MSELPSFKEGLIFDMEDGFNALNPIIITAETFCLFKVKDADYYNKNYEWWKAEIQIYKNSSYTLLTNHKQKIRDYYDLSFCNYEKDVFINTIKWNDVIYVFINPNCTQEIFFNHNTQYKITLTRYKDDKESELNSFTFSIKTDFSNPTYYYINNNIYLEDDGYNVTLTNPATTINCYYDAPESEDGSGFDRLKYYEFMLYNKFNQCVTNTGKVYTNTNALIETISFVCNSLDDESEYILVGYCVSQSGQRIDLPDLIIKTKYTTGKIYANLTIELDKRLAQNKISTKITSLIGEAKDKNNINFIDSEKLDLKNNNNNILFNYYLPTNNFLIRIWINGIKENTEKVTILKLNNDTDYIELYYEDGYFYAIKHSCGLITRYISNAVNNVLNGDIHLSILYCDGRIDICASDY